MTMLHILCQMHTVAFVEVRCLSSSTPKHCVFSSRNKIRDNEFVIRSAKNGNVVSVAAPSKVLNSKDGMKVERKNMRKPKKNNNQHKPSLASVAVIKILDNIDSPDKIEKWIVGQLKRFRSQKQQNNTSISPWAKWSIHEQVEFVKYLQRRRAFNSILSFLSVLDFDQNKTGNENMPIKKQDRLVKVYTTALFAISASRIDRDPNAKKLLDEKAIVLEVLDQMQRNHVAATTLTYVAIFKNLQGRSSDVMGMIRFVEKRELTLPKTERTIWDAEVYHAAIYACGCQTDRLRRVNRKGDKFSPSNSKNDWQTPLSLMQHMQRNGIQPNSKTYLAVLDVLVQNEAKIPIITSIVNQWINAREAGRCDGSQEDRIWAKALNACAVVGDVCQALQFVTEMSKLSKPNLRHCTALLKSFARADGVGRDQLAITALNAMMGNTTAFLEIQDGNKDFQVLLPRTDLDLVALNTAISIVVKNGSYNDAQKLFDRIMGGDFIDSNGLVLSPDRITYHTLLSGCRDPTIAKQIIKEMRFSRRNRRGAIPPNSVTYAHAISVCQRAAMPDITTVNQLMNWANDDQVKPTVFMYASAIWTAQRCGDLPRCLELYEELERSGCKPNGVVLNGLLSALCDHGAHSEAMEVFHYLKNLGFQISSAAMKRLVFATMQTNKLQFSEEKKEEALLQILNRLEKQERAVRISSSIFEALISIYAARSDIDKALDVMNQISGGLDAACFRAILLAYSSCPRSRWYEAVELLHTTITEESPVPGSVDQIALSHVLMICSKVDEFEEGLSLLNLYGISAKELSPGFPQISIVALNALIAACGRGGRPDLSLSLLNDIPSRYGLQPDSRSYRSAIIACNQAQHAQKAYEEDKDPSRLDEEEPFMEWWECSLSLYRRMTEEGLTPDVQTHSSIISSCEAAGEWQRALWVLQTIIDKSKDMPSSLNIYCWNAALSACEKGGAWVEALDLYERMLESPFKPNVVTINSMMEALDKADQKELAQSIYDEALELGLLNPWKTTTNAEGESIVALDLHTFSGSMAKAAIRKTMDTWLDENESTGGLSTDFVIITGKGKHSVSDPVLQEATKMVLLEYGIEATADKSNRGRIVISISDLLDCFGSKSWS